MTPEHPIEPEIMSNLAARVEMATAHILAGEQDEALAISRSLDSFLAGVDLKPRKPNADSPDIYTILVVAHRRRPEHDNLCEMLQALSSARFEILFVENSDRPVFRLDRIKESTNIRLLRLNANAGIGVARCIGIRAAAGEGVIMLDDDGVTTADSIEALIDTFEKYDATCVRGRILQRQLRENSPKHYDLGDSIRQWYCDIEGFSIWRTKHLINLATFDPILYGHEGVELTSRLHLFVGQDAFLYEPKAVMHHDYSEDVAGAKEKRDRYAKLSMYCIHKSDNYLKVIKSFRAMKNDIDARTQLVSRRRFLIAAARECRPDMSVSIIAVSSGVSGSIDGFCKSLLVQNDQGFEVIFVDDRSPEGSSTEFPHHLQPSIERQTMSDARHRRADSLNKAIKMARYDLCVIVNVGDIMIPQWVSWAKAAVRMYPDADLIGFTVPNARSSDRASFPTLWTIASLAVCNIFGLPISSSGLLFRKNLVEGRHSNFQGEGIEDHWIHQVLEDEAVSGYRMPVEVIASQGDIDRNTTARQSWERDRIMDRSKRRQEELLGESVAEDLDFRLFSGWAPIRSRTDYFRARNYGLRLFDRTAARGSDNMESICSEIVRELRYHKENQRKSDCEKTRRRFEDNSQEIDWLKKQIGELEKRNRSLRQGLQDIVESRSWKITAPIRKTLRFLK